MSFLTLLKRQLLHRPWPTILLAGAVLLVSAMLTAVPRLMSDLDDRQLSQRLASLSAIQGDVSGRWTPDLLLDGRLHDPWDQYRAATEAILAAQPEPLRSLLSPAQFVSEFATTPSTVPPAESGYYKVTYHLLIDPDLAEHAHLVEGAWPRLSSDDRDPQQIVVLDETAKRIGWEVGDTVGDGYTLVGTFAPNDATDVRWEHVELGRRYNELSDPNLGIELEVGAFVPAGLAGGDPTGRLQAAFSTTTWFRLDAEAVGSAGHDVDELAAQVTGLTAPSWPITEATEADPSPLTVRLTTELGPVLSSISTQQSLTRALVIVAAAGPLGVGAALVLLAARLTADRRRTSTSLLIARGLSQRQRRRLALTEGLAVGVPAAALGHAAASLVVPGTDSTAAWIPTAALAFVPAAALIATLGTGRAEGARPPKGSSVWRIVGEALVAVLAVAALWQLLAAPASSAGVDWLAVAAPLLCSLVVCLLVARGYPLIMRALTAALKRGKGLVGFLGSARALRSPAGGSLPLLAIVLGTITAITSATLLGTISADVERAAWDEVGADVRVSGAPMTDDLVAQLEAVPGVANVARVAEAAPGTQLTLANGSGTRVRLWTAGPELAGVYAAGPGQVDDLDTIFDADETTVLAGGIGSSGPGTITGLGEVQVISTEDSLPGVRAGAAWALVPTTHWPAEAASTLALITVDEAADPATVAAALADVAGPALIQTADEELTGLRSADTLTSLTRIFALLTLGTLVLLLLTIATGQALAADSRRASGAVLRTLGLPQGSMRWLTAWELAPMVIVALLVGTASGIGIGALLLRSVDLGALTGSTGTTSLYLSPLYVGLVLGGLTLASFLAVVAGAALIGRINIAAELREER